MDNSKTHKMINIISWVVGVFLILRGITLISSSILGALLTIVGAIFLLPIVQNKISNLLNRKVAKSVFIVIWLILTVFSGMAFRASDERALKNGTASQELIAQEEKLKSYKEEREKGEKLREERLLAEEKERESRKYNTSPSSSMGFDECKQKALSVQLAVAGTEYKSAVLVDSDIAYTARVCTNDGSILITCSAIDRKMITTKSKDCPI
ncbi:hypothetical protein [Acinetobacter higginsii]|uniref:hypothetical protein n=1 Tax=Acinetobacter higginsii TaxID=70347 RepID=UPI0026758247|nr:hypothetical protein [Acinetobacter higginsii]MDO3665342.1 hypothetical protein [Acinetobacter higginsii]